MEDWADQVSEWQDVTGGEGRKQSVKYIDGDRGQNSYCWDV